MALIGVDPHKASHTAVAIDANETVLDRLQVRADAKQCERLLSWAERFDERSWAIESAAGLGHLLAQQLVAAGEHVVDVPATLSARARVLGSGRSSKNDPNDATSTAVAALRHRGLRVVTGEDHSAICRLVANRYHQLHNDRQRAICRLHAVLALHDGPGGGAYYQRKLAEGKRPKEAIRALKRRISDNVYRHLIADAARH